MTTIYVLECKDGKYYVGRTDRPLHIRIEEHFSSNGSEWTKKHRPLRVIETIKNADTMDEDIYTKVYMNKFGIDNVRGGSYNSPVLQDYKLKALRDEFSTTEDKCFNCQESGHYIKDCPKKNTKEKTAKKNSTYPKKNKKPSNKTVNQMTQMSRLDHRYWQ